MKVHVRYMRSGPDVPNYNVLYALFENMECRGSLRIPILSIYIMANYRPQHTGFYAPLKSRSSIILVTQHTK